MRVAVSGTHCSGKSTLIERFLVSHRDFAHEPEPYTVLQEDYGEVFKSEPAADDFYRQLEFNISRLTRYQPGENVIYERCPVDFFAYLLALHDLRRDKGAALLVEQSLRLVKDGIKFLDWIVFLPLDDMEDIVVSEWEDQELRAAVDDRLISLLCDDDFNLFTSRGPLILEARGSTAERMLEMEMILGSHLRKGEGE